MWGDSVHFGVACKRDATGLIIEELMDIESLVCLNNGEMTRIDIFTISESALTSR